MIRSLRRMIPILVVALPSAVAGQEVFEVARVPIHPDGDGPYGFVHFRARATCAGADPGLQLAVDRIVVEGVRYGDEYHDEVNGLSFPMEVSKGLLHLKGSINTGRAAGGSFPIQPASVMARLQGFLDWIIIAEGTVPHQMKCSEWTAYADRNFAPMLQHDLEVHRTDGLGDGLFSRAKAAIDAGADLERRLATLEADLASAKTADEYESVLRRVESTDWPDRNGSSYLLARRAEDMAKSARAGMERAAAGETREGSEEVTASTDRKESPEAPRGGGGGAGDTDEPKAEGERDEARESEAVERKAPGTKPSESGTDTDRHLQRVAENRVAYDAAMEKARKAESRGDRRAALRYYEEAQRREPSEQLGRKIASERGALGANDLGQSIARLFMGDPDAELREWQADARRRHAAEAAMVRRFRNSWLDLRRSLIGYNLLAISTLTGSDSLLQLQYREIVKRIPSVSKLDQSDLVHAPTEVVRLERQRPRGQRGDSLYVFAYRGELTGYTSNHGLVGLDITIQKMINERLPGNPVTREDIERAVPLPAMTVRHTPVMAFPLQALEGIGDLEQAMLRWIRPFGADGERKETTPLLIAATTRADLDRLRGTLLDGRASNISLAAGKYEPRLYGNASSEITETLIRAGADVNARGITMFGGTHLHEAAEEGWVALIRTYLANGAAVNATDGSGATPLLLAAAFGHEEAVRVLVEAGADLNRAGEASTYFQRGVHTPLSIARVLGRTDVVALLERHGASETPTPAAGRTTTNAADLAEAKRLFETASAALSKAAREQIEDLDVEPTTLLRTDPFSTDRTVENLVGNRYEVRDGRAYVEQPNPSMFGGIGANGDGWRFPPRAGLAVQLRMRHERGPVNPPVGSVAARDINAYVSLQLIGADGRHVEVDVQAHKQKSPRGYAIFTKDSDGKGHEIVGWTPSAAVSAGENVVEAVLVDSRLHLFINGRHLHWADVPIRVVEEVQLWVSPSTRYSFDDITILALGPEEEADFQAGLLAFYQTRHDEAGQLLKKSAKRGYAPAQNLLAYLYQSGKGVEQDFGKAVELYRDAVKGGDLHAPGSLAWLYYEGVIVEQDHAEAARLFGIGAERGSGWAQFLLGEMYEQGLGLPQDPVQAKRWRDAAAQQGITSNPFTPSRSAAAGDTRSEPAVREAARKVNSLLVDGNMAEAVAAARKVARDGTEDAELIGDVLFAYAYNTAYKAGRLIEAAELMEESMPLFISSEKRARAAFFAAFSYMTHGGAIEAALTCASATETLPLFERAAALIEQATEYRDQSAARVQMADAINQYIQRQQSVIRRDGC